MGVEGLSNLGASASNDHPEDETKVERPSDAEREATRQSELDAEREEHNSRRLSGENG